MNIASRFARPAHCAFSFYLTTPFTRRIEEPLRPATAAAKLRHTKVATTQDQAASRAQRGSTRGADELHRPQSAQQ